MRADLKPLGNPLDIVDRYIAFSPLYAAEIGAVHFDLERKILLTYAARFTAPANIRRQNIPQ